jgi:hypothetical protein
MKRQISIKEPEVGSRRPENGNRRTMKPEVGGQAGKGTKELSHTGCAENAEKKKLICKENNPKILYSVTSAGSSEANQRRSLAGVRKRLSHAKTQRRKELLAADTHGHDKRQGSLECRRNVSVNMSKLIFPETPLLHGQC